MKILEVRCLSISQLPDSYFKQQLIDLVMDANRAMVNVVATKGSIDWAAYIGFPSIENLKPEKINSNTIYYCCSVQDLEGVASNGDKLSEADAIFLFPQYKDKVYRR